MQASRTSGCQWKCHPTGTDDLFGASRRSVRSNDARSFDEAVVKRLTGGPVKARFMGKDFSLLPSHKLILATNYLPTITGKMWGSGDEATDTVQRDHSRVRARSPFAA